MKTNYQSYFEQNRKLWNKKTGFHTSSEFYDLAGFKAGNTSLNSIELLTLGDVSGKSILHLQCHFGMDSLSWAREGAKVTGVDMSDESIRVAKELNDELGLNVTFIRCNVYDLPSHLDQKYDIVFTSYGTIGWLPDMNRWASIVSHFLKPGGIFNIVEFHPFVWMFDDHFRYIKYAYHNDGLIEIQGENTYADKDANISEIEYSWNHSLSEVMTALLSHDIQILSFQEFNYSPYNCFENMKEIEPGQYQVKGLEGKMPMVYSIKGQKVPQ